MCIIQKSLKRVPIHIKSALPSLVHWHYHVIMPIILNGHFHVHVLDNEKQEYRHYSSWQSDEYNKNAINMVSYMLNKAHTSYFVSDNCNFNLTVETIWYIRRDGVWWDKDDLVSPDSWQGCSTTKMRKYRLRSVCDVVYWVNTWRWKATATHTDIPYLRLKYATRILKEGSPAGICDKADTTSGPQKV